MDTPIETKDPELQQCAISMLHNLIQYYTNFKPLNRPILKTNETITHIYISVDRSLEGYGATAHAVINNEGILRTRLIRATNKTSLSTVPGNEMNAIWLGVNLLGQLILALNIIMPCEEFQSIEYSLLTDSLSTALQLIGAPKQCKHARLQEKVIRELNTIELGLNK